MGFLGIRARVDANYYITKLKNSGGKNRRLGEKEYMSEYIVKKGDYLGKIAAAYKISLSDLLKLNPQIKDPDEIFVGQKINIDRVAPAPARFDDEEDDFAQQPQEDKIREFFGHLIATTMLPRSKKAKQNAASLQQELISAYQSGQMDEKDAKQFFSGFQILKNLKYRLGGRYGDQSAIERFLVNNEVRPIKVKGYTITKDDYQFFADAWEEIARSQYGYTGSETSLAGTPMASVGSSGNIFERYIKENEKFTGETPEQVYKVSYIKTPGKVGYSHVKVVYVENPEMSIKEPIKPGEDLDAAKKRAEEKLADKISKEMKFNKMALGAPRQKLDEEVVQPIDADDIADIVVSEINDIFDELPEGSPLKNREVALAALEQIKNALPAMIQGLNVG